MLRLSTIRRRLLLGAGYALVLSGLSLMVAHTGLVRRFVLVQFQTRLGNTMGLAIDVRELDYNLLVSSFELKDIAIRSAESRDMAPPLKAERIVARIPLWRLLRGSIETAQIRIDGLSISWLTASNGRGNWPRIETEGGGGQFRGPAIRVTSGDFILQDDRSGLRVHLPFERLSAAWDPAQSAYALLFESGGGRVQSNGVAQALDRVHLNAALANGGVRIQSLGIASGESELAGAGRIYGSPARLEASADLKLDLRCLAAAGGRLQAHLTSSGPLESPQILATLEAVDVAAFGVKLPRLSADVAADLRAGTLDVRNLSASVFGGRLRGQGRFSLTDGGRTGFTAGLERADLRQAGRVLGYSDFPARRGSIEIAASGPGLQWRRAIVSGSARVDAAKLAFRITGSGDSVRASLNGTWGGLGALQSNLSYRLAGGAVNGTLAGAIPSLARLGAEMELPVRDVDGAAQWSATIGGTANAPAASVRLLVDGLSVGGWTGADLRLQAGYSDGRIGIESAHVDWGGQQLDMHGQIGGLSSGAPLQLDGTLAGPSLSGVFRNLGTAQSVEAGLSGKIQVTGTLDHPAASTNLQADGLSVFGHRFGRANLDAGWQDGALTISRLNAEQEGTSGRLQATACFLPATGHYEIDAAAHDLRAGDPALAGTFQFEAHGKGDVADPSLTAEIDGAGVIVGSTGVGDLNVKVEASSHRAIALVSAPALKATASSTIAMEGAWPFDLTFEAGETRIGDVSLDATVRAAGTLMKPQVNSATAAIRHLALAAAGQEIRNDGPADLSYADGRLQVGNFALISGSSTLRLSGAMPFDDDAPPGLVSLQGTVALAPFSRLLDSEMNGAVDVNASLSGSLRNWRPGGSLTVHDGLFHSKAIPFPIENISGLLNVEGGTLRLDHLTAQAGPGNLRVEGSIPLGLISDAIPGGSITAGEPARFVIQAEKLEFSNPGAEHPATLSLDATVAGEAAAMSLDRLRATLELSRFEAIAGNTRLQQAAPTRIAIADQTARLENLELQDGNSSLKASGTLGLTGSLPLQLEAAGGLDLSVLSALSPTLDTSGMLALNVRASGTLSQPRTTGFVELKNANLLITNPPIHARNVNLRADLEGDRLAVKEFKGSLNGGFFQGGGGLTLAAAGPRDVNLFLKAKDVFSNYPLSIKTTSNVDARLVSRENRLVLEGQIEVQEGFLESSLDLFSSSKTTIDTGEKTVLDLTANPVALDLKLTTRRPVEMDNDLGRISATADLRMGGAIPQPRLTGTVRLQEDDRLYFGDRTYYIERGTVRFLDAPRVTPELDVQAYTRTGDYTIKLGLTGTPDELTTTFTSDPPLSRDDVIAVLLTGKTVAENRGVDMRALEAQSLATGALNAALSSQLHRAVGVSRVSIQPGAVAAESNPGARVTITQDFTQSLRLLYSMNLSDSNDQIWVGEYDLSRRFTTRAVKQHDNTYRGEFRHDVRFGSASGNAAVAAARPAKRKITAVRFTEAGPFSTEQLAKVFKIKAGKQYRSAKVRKGSERLTKFFMKRGYLESRVRLDREDNDQGVGLTVRTELGPLVNLDFQGASLPGKQKSRVRRVWHSGISDQQRPQAAKDAILGHLAGKGYLRAQADCRVSGDAVRKAVLCRIAPGIRYRGVEIVPEGAGSERRGAILSLLRDESLRKSVYRDPALMIEAVTAYYQRRGYLAAKVSAPVFHLDDGRRTGSIAIPIREGPEFHVGELRFIGNGALTAPDLAAGLPLQAGAVFEPARVEPALSALRLKYGKLGYREATIDYALDRHDDRALIDISFTIVEKMQTSIAAIRVEGNRRTSEKFARSQLKVAEGQVANTQQIRESVKSLSQTGAYTATDIEVRPLSESVGTEKPVQAADLVVAVAEPKPYRLLYGGLYDTGNGPGFIADIQNHNSLGAGRVLGLRARKDSETDELRLYLIQPTLRGRGVSTTFGTYYTRETEDYQTIPTQKLGVSIQQDLQLRSRFLLSYGYRYEKQRGFVPDPAAPDIPETVVAVAPVTLTITRDGRDSFLDATHGSFLSHGFELAPRFLGSDYPYVRYYGQYFKYFPLTHPRPVPFGEKAQPSRLIFATGSRLGMQKGFNSSGAVLTDRFYAGGGTTVRGFKQDELGPRLANGQPAGGNAVLVFNNELRYPLFWIFDAVSFVDVGNVFPRVSDVRLGELRAAGGFGLRIRNPFVVLRFDYGFKFGRRPGETMGAFFFSIGQAF
jgi:outer membrane protein assembly complex protein YaeT